MNTGYEMDLSLGDIHHDITSILLYNYKYIITEFADGTIRILDRHSFNSPCLRTFVGHTGAVRALKILLRGPGYSLLNGL